MKLFKKIMKVVFAYAICITLAYSIVLRVREIDERDSKVLQENNYEEYYVWENK